MDSAVILTPSVEQTGRGVKRWFKLLRWNLSRALIVTRREVVDMYRDWRILAPIIILTIISLIIMVLMFLPLDDETLGLLQVYDNLICVIFLIDFTLNLRASPKKSDYFIKERGWLDGVKRFFENIGS